MRISSISQSPHKDECWKSRVVLMDSRLNSSNKSKNDMDVDQNQWNKMVGLINI